MNVFLKFLNLIFPIKCLSCGKPGVLACESCLSSIELLDRQECPSCRSSSAFGAFCGKPGCRSRFLGAECFFDHLVVCSRYDKKGLLKKLIERLKYKFSEEVAVHLCFILRKCYESPKLRNFFDQLLQDGLVVAVPLHNKRLKDRGFNQAELLAGVLCYPDHAIHHVLARTVYTPPQAHLNRQERLKNLAGAFVLKKDAERLVAGRSIILVDDVCTTGSTLNECAKILREAGAEKIVALVLARGDRR